MTITKLMDNMFEYNNNCVGDIFPMDRSCFYNEIWNDWKNDNKIPMDDALSLWDNMMKTDLIDNTMGDEENELENKQICEKIRLMKIDCDF